MSGKDWRLIAADMIEAAHFSVDGLTDESTLTAAAFVFDEGIFFLPESARAEVVTMLRRAALPPAAETKNG